jgi:hypothetical protein
MIQALHAAVGGGRDLAQESRLNDERSVEHSSGRCIAAVDPCGSGESILPQLE